MFQLKRCLNKKKIIVVWCMSTCVKMKWVIIATMMFCVFGVADMYTISVWRNGHKLTYGCHSGQCWSYCGIYWTSGEWCYIGETTYKGNFSPYTVRCKSPKDCSPHMKWNHPRCVGLCSWF